MLSRSCFLSGCYVNTDWPAAAEAWDYELCIHEASKKKKRAITEL